MVAAPGRQDLLKPFVSDSCAVLIAASDLLGALEERAADLEGEILSFPDADALLALEVITKRRPRVVMLERTFAATPRGTALINRIKADAALVDAEIRVASADGEYMRVVPRPSGVGPKPLQGPGSPGSLASGLSTSSALSPARAAEPFTGQAPTTTAVEVQAQPLDQRGTRRAPRFKIAAHVDILVDGNVASLVDLSLIGAQVVSQTILRPNQRVRLALTDDVGNVRFNASVAWASFVMPPKFGPRYRAGLEFVDADANAVDAFRIRHS